MPITGPREREPAGVIRVERLATLNSLQRSPGLAEANPRANVEPPGLAGKPRVLNPFHEPQKPGPTAPDGARGNRRQRARPGRHSPRSPWGAPLPGAGQDPADRLGAPGRGGRAEAGLAPGAPPGGPLCGPLQGPVPGAAQPRRAGASPENGGPARGSQTRRGGTGSVGAVSEVHPASEGTLVPRGCLERGPRGSRRTGAGGQGAGLLGFRAGEWGPVTLARHRSPKSGRHPGFPRGGPLARPTPNWRLPQGRS